MQREWSEATHEAAFNSSPAPSRPSFAPPIDQSRSPASGSSRDRLCRPFRSEAYRASGAPSHSSRSCPLLFRISPLHAPSLPKSSPGSTVKKVAARARSVDTAKSLFPGEISRPKFRSGSRAMPTVLHRHVDAARATPTALHRHLDAARAMPTALHRQDIAIRPARHSVRRLAVDFAFGFVAARSPSSRAPCFELAFSVAFIFVGRGFNHDITRVASRRVPSSRGLHFKPPGRPSRASLNRISASAAADNVDKLLSAFALEF